ncbi:MAG: 30S ribosome-binding factor RbfA [Pseudomonadota bacterium]
MAREYSRTQRVADHLQRELAGLIQHELRDPRLGMVSLTSVDISRDLGHARVYYTVLNADNSEEAKEVTEVLNRASGFLRSELSRDSSMRSVPQLRFYFDNSVGRGRELEDLIRRAADADRELGLRDDDAEEQ